MDKSSTISEKCYESSMPTSSSAGNWWADHATSLSSWTAGAFTNNHHNSNSNCSGGEEDASISTSFTTNASNNSGLSNESSQLLENTSTNHVRGETVSHNDHLWNHILLSVGSGGDLQNISNGTFQPACDYLKKIDSGWDFFSQSNINNIQKNVNGFTDSLYPNKNPSSVINWSIAPAEVEISQQVDQFGCHSAAVKNECVDNDIGDYGLFRSGLCTNQMGIEGDNGKYYYSGIPDMDQSANPRGFGDMVRINSLLSKPVLDINVSSKPMLKTLNLTDRRKQDFQSSYQPIIPRGNILAKNSGRGNGVANEGKRKKSEDNSATFLKKTKPETSTISSSKLQIPKAKLGDKITALQQIVSPFGKTDTASVLWEAIGYIKCLQEQVQLLSNPYLKTNIMKDPWGGLDRKDRGDMKPDLKSRGLCLVPTSCTPQVYHDNSGSDYWTPTYRGCFYR